MSNRDNVLEKFRADSAWKDKAAANIEKYRKGDAKITLTNSEGKPIENAKIRAVQKKHEFKFGANVFMLDGIESEEKLENYKKYFAELFNMATLPFYWDALEPTEGAPRYDKDSPKKYRRPAIDVCMEFCEENGIEPREHALAYDRFFPKWLYDASVEKTKEAYERRCREIAERYADKIPTIEVTNEMEWNDCKTAFYNEPDFIEWCFKTARRYFPDNQLCINEHSWLSWVDRCRTTDKYYSYIEANMLKGAPIDAVGMQFHMFESAENEYERTRPFYDPENLYRHMDMYARFGKPLQVTEVTVPAYSNDAYDEQIQAQIIENLYRIWFSHPAMEQIVYWNFIDGYAHVWVDDEEAIKQSQGNMTLGENVFYGGLLRFDSTPKPAYYTIKKLLQEEWHTEAELVTAPDGSADFRGFYGDYELQIEVGGKTYTENIKLAKQSNGEIKIKI